MKRAESVVVMRDLMRYVEIQLNRLPVNWDMLFVGMWLLASFAVLLGAA